MVNQISEFQAKLYVYDLSNCAHEFGFKADEVWEVGLASEAEKIDIEKKYFPTVASKILPDTILETFNTVKEKLIQRKSEVENKLDKNNISARKLNYLIAFNPKRQR